MSSERNLGHLLYIGDDCKASRLGMQFTMSLYMPQLTVRIHTRYCSAFELRTASLVDVCRDAFALARSGKWKLPRLPPH